MIATLLGIARHIGGIQRIEIQHRQRHTPARCPGNGLPGFHPGNMGAAHMKKMQRHPRTGSGESEKTAVQTTGEGQRNSPESL